MEGYSKNLIKGLYLGYLKANRAILHLYYKSILYSTSLFFLIFFPFLLMLGPDNMGFSAILVFFLLMSIFLIWIFIMFIASFIDYKEKILSSFMYWLYPASIIGSVFFLLSIVYIWVNSDQIISLLEGFSFFIEGFFKEFIFPLLMWIFYIFTFGVIGLYMIAQTGAFTVRFFKDILGLKKAYYVALSVLMHVPLVFVYAFYYLFTITILFSISYDLLANILVWVFGSSILIIHFFFLGSRIYFSLKGRSKDKTNPF